jgi:hypothetical protein
VGCHPVPLSRLAGRMVRRDMGVRHGNHDFFFAFEDLPSLSERLPGRGVFIEAGPMMYPFGNYNFGVERRIRVSSRSCATR